MAEILAEYMPLD